MHKRIDWIGIETQFDRTITIKVVSRKKKIKYYTNPSESSLYRLLNNEQIFDICAHKSATGIYLEITPK